MAGDAYRITKLTSNTSMMNVVVLQSHIGKICHIYLDDIIIWSDFIDQHIKDV